MRKTTLTVALLLAATLDASACIYKTDISYGKVTAEQVSSIKEGVTTKPELLQVLGEPAYKEAIDEHQQKWIYSYTGVKASDQAFADKPKLVLTDMLNIVLKDGVVVNCSEENMPAASDVQAMVN